MTQPLLQARGVRKIFERRAAVGRGRRERVVAVDGVDLELRPGRTLALIGESGSGKTTLARCLLRLVEPTSGEVLHRGTNLLVLPGGELRRRRRALQMIFQDAALALDPRQSVADAVAEPLIVHGLCKTRQERRQSIERLLDEVGIPDDAASRYPHEISGGQRQRVGIARALASDPELLVADEPVSALDVAVRAQIVNLLLDLQERRGLALLLIAHDLGLVASVADEIAVMYLGRIVEAGPAATILRRPAHPYTAALTASSRDRVGPEGGGSPGALVGSEPPSPSRRLSGCPFHPRCPRAAPTCRTSTPPRFEIGPGHVASCHDPIRVDGTGR